MNPQGLQLRDIHLPAEPSWWPPAPGWWLLTVLVVVMLGLGVRAALRWLRARRRMRLLQAEFAAAADVADPLLRLRALSELLRRAARLADPLAPALQGEAWLAFLDRYTGDSAFTQGAGRMLLDAPYRAAAVDRDVDALIEPARRAFFALVRPR